MWERRRISTTHRSKTVVFMPINSVNSYKRLRLVAARINSEAIVIVYRCRQ